MSPSLDSKSLITKRTVVVGDLKTSVALEEPFWNALQEIAGTENLSLNNLVTLIDSDRRLANLSLNLSSALRIYVTEHYRRLAKQRSGDENGRT
jgi:predicted DNA-binding ribbon-helix-helix protein